MALRYYADNLSGAKQIANTVKAIDYAIANGAKVINFSANGALPAEEERSAILRAQEKGVIFVVASGNQGVNTDFPGRHSYPANYNLENIISVSSHNIRGALSSFSNYGKNSIFISAPGEQIFSTLPNNRFGYMSGTSQATAFVSGVVALMLSVNSQLKAKDIKDILKKSIVANSALAEMQEKISSGGMLNADRSLAAVKTLLLQNRSLAADSNAK
jgi:subtilisin family serine protease